MGRHVDRQVIAEPHSAAVSPTRQAGESFENSRSPACQVADLPERPLLFRFRLRAVLVRDALERVVYVLGGNEAPCFWRE